MLHTPHRNDPHRNDLNTDFPLRIGSVAGDSYPGAIPMDSADKTVLAMKVASATGGVGVKHAVPHTLVAVGVHNGENALKKAIARSKECMDHADHVQQSGEKPVKYNGIDMLVDLDSLQELEVVTSAPGKVFQNF